MLAGSFLPRDGGAEGSCPPSTPTLLPRRGAGTAGQPLPHPTELPGRDEVAGRQGGHPRRGLRTTSPRLAKVGGSTIGIRPSPSLRWAPGLPAQLRRQTPHTGGGGEVAHCGGLAATAGGNPRQGGIHRGTGSAPRSRSVSWGGAGTGPDPGASAGVPGGCSQRLFLRRKRQNVLGSSPEPGSEAAAGGTHGDAGTCSSA